MTLNFLGTYQSPDGVQEVAIKIPKITWNTGCSPIEVENLKSFYAEAQITIGFDHENVLSCLGISTGLIYIVNVAIRTQTFTSLTIIMQHVIQSLGELMIFEKKLVWKIFLI